MPSRSPEFALRVNGREYRGWKRVSFTRGIEAASGRFELGVTDRWSGQSQPWPIREEDECVLVFDGRPLLTGYVDSRSMSYSADGRSVSVSGRDRAGALVDCSAVLDKWEFKNAPLLTLARKIGKPFNVSVSAPDVLDASARIDKLSIDPGDTAFVALERACRMVGLLPISDGLGGLVLTRPGSARAFTELVEGQNILSASADYSGVDRFRTYRVLGQRQGSDDASGKAVAAVKGEAADETVRRAERVWLIRAEGGITTAQAKRRAEWEATVRAARGYAVDITVQGWTQGDGSLWPINALTRVRSPWLELDTDMLIVEATYSLDNSSGTITRLSLRRPDAYLPEPAIKPAKAKPGKVTSPWSELQGGVTAPEANYSSASGQSVYVPPGG